MEPFTLIGLLVLLGLMFGSFAGAQVWRIRARQLRDEDERLAELTERRKLSADEAGEKVYLNEEAKERSKERRRLDGLLGSVSKDYSRCLLCQHKLAWYDLLPLVSWLSTSGKCRYCRKSIGVFEPLMEIGVALAFALSYLFWPLPLAGAVYVLLFILWLVSIVFLAILFAYDKKWFLLPDMIVFPLIGVGGLMCVLRTFDIENLLPYAINVLGGVLVLSGLYFLLWVSSKGQWVGFGDVKLGLGLALLLADWKLALLALFLANLIGTLIVIPGMLSGKLTRKAHVPFGPLLIAGAFISMLAGEKILVLYLGTVF